MNLRIMFSFSVVNSFQPAVFRLLSTSMVLRPSLSSVLSQSVGVTKSLNFLPAAAPPPFHHGFFFSTVSSSISTSALGSR